MKSTFFEHIRPTTEALTKLWEKGDSVFVFDTNVLLNLYRYSAPTTHQFLNVLTHLDLQIWIPHHVGLEYFNNRLSVLNEEAQKYQTFLKDTEKLINDVKNSSRNPFFSETLTEKLYSLKDDVDREVKDILNRYENRIHNDDIKERLTSIFDGKVGKTYSTQRLQEIFSEGEKRYREKIPPGYCDNSKPSPNKFGDLVIWNQIIDHAISERKNIIFVLDDEKEDWWLENKGQTISGRTELTREFYEKTSKFIYFYKPFQFLRYASEHKNQPIDPTTIEEVENYSANINSILEAEISGRADNFIAFFETIISAGYQASCESNGDLHSIKVILPNIPDLTRRFH